MNDLLNFHFLSFVLLYVLYSKLLNEKLAAYNNTSKYTYTYFSTYLLAAKLDPEDFFVAVEQSVSFLVFNHNLLLFRI